MFLTMIPGILGCSVKFQDSIEVDGPCSQTIFPFLVTMIKHMKVAGPIIFTKILIMSKMGKMGHKRRRRRKTKKAHNERFTMFRKTTTVEYCITPRIRKLLVRIPLMLLSGSCDPTSLRGSC